MQKGVTVEKKCAKELPKIASMDEKWSPPIAVLMAKKHTKNSMVLMLLYSNMQLNLKYPPSGECKVHCMLFTIERADEWSFHTT